MKAVGDEAGGRSSLPERPLKKMFDAVPRRYDLLNRLLTLKQDERWRRLAAMKSLDLAPRRILDLCCGTGDMALQLAELTAVELEIIGLDFSSAMLEVARRKAAEMSSGPAPRFIEGDASAMDFEDGYFDAVCIAFAFRNVTWKNPLCDAVLHEVKRVLRPGGTFTIVETSQPPSRVLKLGFHTFLSAAVAPIGGLISGRKSPYRYLAKSARNYFTADEVVNLLTRAGFSKVHATLLMGGVAAIHQAEV